MQGRGPTSPAFFMPLVNAELFVLRVILGELPLALVA